MYIDPLLIGPAQGALTQMEARDYGKAKEAILYRLEITPETYQQKFWARKGMEGLCPRLLAQTLRDLVEWWLQPETWSIEEVVDCIILEQFLTDLGGSIQCWVRQHQPKTVEEALRLAEDYVTAEAEGEGPKKEHPGGTRMRQHAEGPSKGRRGEVTRPTGQEPRGWDVKDIIYYRCREKGHVS